MVELGPELAREASMYIRDVPDFPKPGIVFKDVTPLFLQGPTMRRIVDAFVHRYRDQHLTAIAAIEARGFLLGAPLAIALGVGLVLLRKPGKLPWKKVARSYSLEYGTDTLEMHEDALGANAKIVVVDDLLATGGTMHAAIDLLISQGADVVETAFLVELAFLGGRARLHGRPVAAVVRY